MLTPHLTTFAAVARHGSLTRAAAELHLSQPAVTQHIASLEEELACRLLDRHGRGVRLTEAGERLLAYCRKVEGATIDLRRELDDMRSGTIGHLSVGAGLTICIFVLPGLLAQYRRSHPGIELHVRSGRTQQVVDMVLDEQVDLGLVTSPVQHRAIKTVPLYHDRMVIVARPDHPLASAVQIDAATLATQRLILFERGSGFRTYLQEVFEGKGVLLHADFELDSIEAIKEMVLAGLGLSVVPEIAVARELAAGTLTTISLRDWPVMERTTSLIMRHVQAQPPAAVQSFVELVEARFVAAAAPGPATDLAPEQRQR
jgi:DNA-binding transcriptional LysR family regulator